MSKEKTKRTTPVGFFPSAKKDNEVLSTLAAPEPPSAESPLPPQEEASEFDSPSYPEPASPAPTEEATAPAAEDALPEIVDPSEIFKAPAPTEEATDAPSQGTPENFDVNAGLPSEPSESEQEREYGAPQPLYEDIIPDEFSPEAKKKKKEEEKARMAAIKRAEEAERRRQKEWEAEEKKRLKQEAADEKRRAKNEKQKAKTAAVIAAVEAKAVKTAKAEIKRSTGEDFDYEEPAAPPSKPEQNEPEKLYSRLERKLRRKYKLERDELLSENDVIPGFVIAKGENVIRSYNCLSSGSGEGTVVLTDKRLLINAGERSEIAIEQVTGIKFSNCTRFNILKFILGFLLLALGGLLIALPFIKDSVSIPMITGEAYKKWFTYIFFPCGGISVILALPLLFTSIKTSFYFYVYAHGGDSAFIEYKSAVQAKRENKNKVYRYLVAKPGKESDKAARELGALILEVKQGYSFEK